MDLYRPVLEKVLFPVFEAVRGRPTAPLVQFLRGSERWSLEALRDLQAGLLRRLIRHAVTHTAHYRTVFGDRGMAPEDVTGVHDLHHLPLLGRDEARATLDARTAASPAWEIESTTRGFSGPPVTVRYTAESRNWRDAVRWRGHGWAGHRIGMRTLHYWEEHAPSAGWLARGKAALDHALKRDLYVDSVVRSEPALARAVEQVASFAPEVIVAHADGAAALARFVNQHGLRRWRDIPVIVAASRLWPHDRAQIEAAFGPAFASFGCREVHLIGAECEAHDGMHTAMENLIVEVLVRGPGGSVRAARPGEIGEVAVTDLHNLACPLIRYLTGDLAVARAEGRCGCGRSLATIGPIDGRVAAVAGEIPVSSAGRLKVLGADPVAARPVMLA